ncbi:MAG: hypothetical protein ACPL4K_05725, partial [Candidatus Margulisiibacteriota bacterium]
MKQLKNEKLKVKNEGIYYYFQKGYLHFSFFILPFTFICSSVFAMGEVPSTREVVVPRVEYVREFGLPGSGERQFYFPRDVKVAVVGDLETGLGNLFVADTGNNRIQRLSEDGAFVYQFGGFGTNQGKFNSPDG